MRRIIFWILAAWLLISLPSEAAVLVPERTEAGRREDLYTLSFELELDEETDRARSRWTLQNRGEETVETTLTLPLCSAGVKAGSLALSSSAEAVRISEEKVFGKLAPGETAVFSYEYQTKSTLVHAGAIGFDYTQLTFSEDAEVGHAQIRIQMKEEDLPLVQEVFPVSFTLQDRTVSVELTCFHPQPYLRRFWIAKETWRNLKSGREYMANEAQQFVLSNYRRWFKEGLGLTAEEMESSTQIHLFSEMMGVTGRKNYNENQPEFTPLYKLNDFSSAAYRDVFDYLYLRELEQKQVPLSKAVEENGRSYSWYILNTSSYYHGTVMQELLRQKFFGEEKHISVIAYVLEPSLEEVTLYRAEHSMDGMVTKYYQASQEALLKAVPIEMYDYRWEGKSIRYRSAVLPLASSYDADAVNDYLDAIGAETFVLHKMLDEREGAWGVEPYVDEAYIYHRLFGCFSLAGEGNLSEEDLLSQAVYYARDETKFLDQQDSLLSELKVPAFTHYTGYVAMKDARALYHTFYWSGYLIGGGGAELYAGAAQSETGQALLAARDERVRREKEQINDAVKAAEPARLNEVPYYTAGDLSALRTLSFDLNIDEESSLVYSELIWENTGTEPVTACLSLPLLTGRIKEGSFFLILPDGTQAADRYRVYFTLEGGASLKLSFRYQTAVSLIHAGAIGLDLKTLQPDPSCSVGRFRVSVRLTAEDVPLVTEIRPVNYTFDGTTVTAELFEFAPNALLNRFVIAKTTYRQLRSDPEQERELSPAEEYFFRHYREWFRDGIGIREEKRTEPFWFDEIFAQICRHTAEKDPSGVSIYPEVFAERLGKEERQIIYHLVIKELMETGQLSLAENLIQGDSQNFPLLTRELLRQNTYEEDPIIIAVEYAPEPTLAGVSLMVQTDLSYSQPYESGKETVLETVHELILLRTKAPNPAFVRWEWENLRIMMIPEYTADRDLAPTLEAVGASLYIQSKLLDNRDGKWEALEFKSPSSADPIFSTAGYYSVLPDGILALEDLKAAMMKTDSEKTYLAHSCFEREDERLSACGIPAFIKYFGYVQETDQGAVAVPFSGGAVFGTHYGLMNYRDILARDSVAALLEARRINQEQTKQAVIRRIEAAQH